MHFLQYPYGRGGDNEHYDIRECHNLKEYREVFGVRVIYIQCLSKFTTVTWHLRVFLGEWE